MPGEIQFYLLHFGTHQAWKVFQSFPELIN